MEKTPDIIYYLNPAESLPQSNYFSSIVDHRWKLTVASYCRICQNYCTNYKELKTAAVEISGIMIGGMVLGVAEQTAAAEDQILGLWEGYCVKRLKAMSETTSSIGRQYSLTASLHHDLDMNADSLHVEVPPNKYRKSFTEGVAQDCRSVFTTHQDISEESLVIQLCEALFNRMYLPQSPDQIAWEKISNIPTLDCQTALITNLKTTLREQVVVRV